MREKIENTIKKKNLIQLSTKGMQNPKQGISDLLCQCCEGIKELYLFLDK